MTPTDPALSGRVEDYAEEAEHEAARIEREAADLPHRVVRDSRCEREKAADLRALLARVRELEAELHALDLWAFAHDSGGWPRYTGRDHQILDFSPDHGAFIRASKRGAEARAALASAPAEDPPPSACRQRSG